MNFRHCHHTSEQHVCSWISEIVLNFCKMDFASLAKSLVPLLNFILFKTAIFIAHILGELLLFLICDVIFSYVFAVTPVSVS